ncbi:MAG TPA: hypothetical protein VJ843_05115 [Candidatus Saccharimonadales bacterium]|nr:hypothetical protein [Candidatus Saccharimonadales bacterium]
MHGLVQKLQSDNPTITLKEGTVFVWSPKKRQVTYIASKTKSDPWSLLHEVSHGLLDHTTYNSDIDLLQKEVEAWEKAVALSHKYDVVIDRTFIENCLDSYRDWLHKRSICPACRLQGIQKSLDMYSCINCANTWNVTKERFCRPYRRLQQK